MSVAGSGRPRVVLIGPAETARGGIAQFGARLAEALAEDGETCIIAFRTLYPRWTRAGRTQSEARRAGTLVPWRPGTWRAADREIERFGPDLILLQWWHPAFGPCVGYLAARARMRGQRVAFVCHNARPHEAFPFTRTLSMRALRHADRLIALSSDVANELRTLAPRVSIEILAHPPNLGTRSAPTGCSNWAERAGVTDEPVVGFFGTVRPYKGLADLIHAFASVRAQVPNAVLVVAGEFYEPAVPYQKLVHYLGIEDAVRFLPGYVADADVHSFFTFIDLLVLPYRTASQSGIVPLAASWGTPVIATRVGGLPEAIGEAACLVPPADSGALADAIVHALKESPAPPAPLADGWDTWRRTLLQMSEVG